MRPRTHLFLIGAAIGGFSTLAIAAPKDLTELLQPVLEESKLPSIAAAIVVGDELKGIGAVGLRKFGGRDQVTIDDKYHLGSCTKSMTATLAAILIEDGLLKWDTTIGEALDKKVRKIHDDYRDVTIEQLLAHVGGVPGEAPRGPWGDAFDDQGKLRPEKQRLKYVKAVLAEKPAYPPGTGSDYSNTGYAIAGVMLEVLARDSWEDLLTDRVFKPLGMKSAGFRPPEGKHPWGHKAKTPTRDDNPDAIGPAATVHASIGDWAKFAGFHLARKPGTLLKKKESFDKLNGTLKNSGQRGVGGWLIADSKRFGGRYIEMFGSNTMWKAGFWILPGLDTAIVVATNSAQENSTDSCRTVRDKLLEGFLPE